jgi:isopenicillin-N N-acyltransferase-like protein
VFQAPSTARLGDGRVVYLRGTPYEQGRQLGKAAGDLIRENIVAATTLCDQIAAGLNRSAYRAMTLRNEAWVSTEFPELLGELQGIADGAEIEYPDLLDLNVNTDVAYARAYSELQDCTQILALGPATVDGKTYQGKTRDLRLGPKRHVLLHREYDDGTFRNEFQIAGQLTLPVGVNSHGVALTTSGQWSPRIVVDLTRADRAWHILNLQPLLRHARSVDDVIRMVREQPRVCGMLLVASDADRAVTIEVTGDEAHVFEPEDGLLARTNHFLSTELRDVAPTLEENRGTYERRARACELARQRHGSISMHDILRILSDHAEPPVQSICRHPSSEDGGATYAATIICPQDRRMWALFGNPCEGIQAVGVPSE